MSRRKEIIAANEVSQMYTFPLGGFPQKVLIEGKKKGLPIVIFLHGGPGTPIPFSAGCRGLFPQFTDRFLMVYWDQLGCGINHCDLDDDMRISHFVDMTADLVCQVKNLFPQNKLLLFSASWGSVLSAEVLRKTDLVDGVVACGQITHHLFFNSPLTKALEASSIPASKLDSLRQIEPQMICPEDLSLISSCIRKYTQGYNNKKGKIPVGQMCSIIFGMMTSPDYSMPDFRAVMMNGYTGKLGLWPELLRLDLTENLKAVQVPYRMLQGDTDIVATTEFVQSIVNSSANPHLTCQVIPDTGHYPSPAAMDAALNALIELAES